MSRVRAGWISLGAGLLILALKWVAYGLTGSIALYSDALESLVNVVAAAVAVFVLIVSARPADSDHAYGHSKAEYFSSGFEGALILVAAILIIGEAGGRLLEPKIPEALDIGVLVSLAAAVANGFLGLFLVRSGDRENSPALKADGAHILTDVWTTAGVWVGIGLALLTGWWVLDPLLAIVVGINILFTAYQLLRGSISGLMDQSLTPAELETLRSALAEAMGPALQIHALKTRRSGPTVFVEFHLVVPGITSVAEADLLCDQLEATVEKVFAAANITIHVEPEGKVLAKGFLTRGD